MRRISGHTLLRRPPRGCKIDVDRACRVAGLVACYGVQMAHHEEAQVAGHLIASTPHGTYVEAFHPDRDPVFWNIDAGRAPLRDGMLAVPDRPGLGIEFDWDWIRRYRLDTPKG